MDFCNTINLKKADFSEVRSFCDTVGLVVLGAMNISDCEAADHAGEMTFIAEDKSGAPVGCCHIDRFSADGISCRLNYYLCKAYEYDELRFREMLFGTLSALLAERSVDRIICTQVKKMFARQRFFPENGFVVEIINACVNPNGERLVEEDYVIYREEFVKRHGN